MTCNLTITPPSVTGTRKASAKELGSQIQETIPSASHVLLEVQLSKMDGTGENLNKLLAAMFLESQLG